MSIQFSQLISAASQLQLLPDIDEQQIITEARRATLSPLEYLCLQKRITESAFYQAYAQLQQLHYAEPSPANLDEALISRVPLNIIQRYQTIPVKETSNEIQVLTANPDNEVARSTITQLFNKTVSFLLTSPTYNQYLIDYINNEILSQSTITQTFDSVNCLHQIFTAAYLIRASDIHIEPEDNKHRIRMRIDGKLQDCPIYLLPEQGNALISRIKVLAELDIAEQRKTQDGSFTTHMSPHTGAQYDIRVAVLPTQHGERITMRLLEANQTLTKLPDLGFSAIAQSSFEQTISQPHGIVLVTGPTGSGKSTTLYAALEAISDNTKNIITIEDPIEKRMPGISQVEVGKHDKLQFHDALRSILRHDPDVIMIGEIRDQLTAEIAIRAAMTGHLVFSTLHTNRATAAVSRLVDLGIEPFLVASTLIATISQRLVRRLCPNCSQRIEPSERYRQLLQLGKNDYIYQATGCPSCLGTGYLGRIGVFEMLSINQRLSKCIIENSGDESALIEAAGDQYLSLFDDCRHKVRTGLTSVEEVLSILPVSHFGVEDYAIV